MAAFSASAILHKNQISFLPSGCKSRVVLLDTNLLVLLVTAMLDVDLFSSFKRVKNNFTRQDAQTLGLVIEQFQSAATNAYVLAETSNIGNELHGFRRDLWYSALSRFANASTEAHISTNTVAGSSLLIPLGITDAALGELSDPYVVLTADFPLYGRLERLGRVAVNFNHLRSF